MALLFREVHPSLFSAAIVAAVHASSHQVFAVQGLSVYNLRAQEGVARIQLAVFRRKHAEHIVPLILYFHASVWSPRQENTLVALKQACRQYGVSYHKIGTDGFRPAPASVHFLEVRPVACPCHTAEQVERVGRRDARGFLFLIAPEAPERGGAERLARTFEDEGGQTVKIAARLWRGTDGNFNFLTQ